MTTMLGSAVQDSAGKDMFAEAIELAGTNPCAVASHMGLDASVIHRKVSAKHSEQPTLRDVLRSPGAVRRAVAELLTAVDERPLNLSPEHHAMRCGAESGDVQRVTIEAAPGGYDDAELARLEREHMEAMEAHRRALVDIKARRHALAK
jgi:hypothetical protein